MAEETAQEKTEEATPKRLQDSRDKGQIARSKEFNTFGLTLVGALVLLTLGGQIALQLSDIMMSQFQFTRDDLLQTSQMSSELLSALSHVGPIMLILFFVLFVATAILPGFIGGWSLSSKALMPDLKRMDPIAGVKRIFSVKGLMELVKSLAKFVVIGMTGILLILAFKNKVLGLAYMSTPDAVIEGLTIAGISFIVISMSLMLIALVDIPFQLWDHKRQLKMTKQEVKDENKETEGSPEVKSKLRQLQNQFARQRMMQELPSADVVITNPTHFAVALRYEHGSSGAPILVAKGTDLVAKNIKKVATEHKIPIISAPPLARSLYYTTDLNQQIPLALYKAVAQILALVFNLKKRPNPKYASLGSFEDLPIPEEYQY